jgi:hypothetical protein
MKWCGLARPPETLSGNRFLRKAPGMSHSVSEDLPPSSPLPPGPALPPEAQARIWLERPGALLEACRRDYGDIFTLRLGDFGTMVMVADPEAVRQVFKAPPDWYECRGFNDSYRYVMGDTALFVQDGAAHRRLKRMLMPLFRGDRLGPQGAEITRLARAAFSGRAAGEDIRLRPLLHDVTLNALLKLVFGDRQAPRDQVMAWFRTEVWRDMRSWKPWTRLSRLHPRLRALLTEELALRRTDPPDTPDLLSSLLTARDEDGGALSDAEIQDQVLMLTITAGDAVAAATAWALWHAAADPAAQEDLRAEHAALGPDPDPATIARQPRLTAFVHEVLRLHTILPTVSGRRLTAPRDFMGYRLGAGVSLAPCEYLVHRRADIFEDPMAFMPDRFMDRTYPPHAYFPFGGGQRSCLGTHLAPLTIKLILAEALSQIRLRPTVPEPPREVRFGTLIAPDEALVLTVSFKNA